MPVANKRTIGREREYGMSDEALATAPTVFRDDLLKGQVALISGGGSGLGRAMAFLMARLGAEVMICGRREEKLVDAAAAIERHVGTSVGYRAMTIRDPEAVEALMAETWERFGKLSILVNNGGGQFPQAAIDFADKGWRAVIDTNLNGTWYMMQRAAKLWRDNDQPGSDPGGEKYRPPGPPRRLFLQTLRENARHTRHRWKR